MNEKDRQAKRNRIRRLLRHQSGIHVNCIRINTGNTRAHELAKFELAWKLHEDRHSFICEAEFESPFKKRADVVDLDDGVVYEIVVSESEESIVKKQGTYPLPVIVVRPGPVIDNDS